MSNGDQITDQSEKSIGSCDQSSTNHKTDQEQVARTELRAGFLSVISCLKERQAEVTTCEGNKLDCKFIGFDRNIEKISVEDLITPTGATLNHAVIRTGDSDKIVLRPRTS